jgi:pectate lyase
LLRHDQAGYPKTSVNLSEPASVRRGLGRGRRRLAFLLTAVALATVAELTSVGCGGEGSGAARGGTGGGTPQAEPDAGSATGGASGTGGRLPDGNRTGGTTGALGGKPGTGGGAPAGSSGGATVCGDTPPDSDLPVGWATMPADGITTTTGGGGATPQTVTSLAELNNLAAGTTPAVIWVSGSVSGIIKVGSNKTIVGKCGAQLHGHVDISGSSNVIVRNIAIVGYGVGSCALDPKYDATIGCSSGDDAMSVQRNAHHIWIDHCDISDGTDGNLDITTGANFVTVSWTKFHYSPRTDPTGSDSTGASGHRFSNLVGGDDNASGDAAALNVTWHHDWWSDNVVERQPRVRFGKNHLFNNLWASSTSSYCVRAGKQAEILIENSAFVGVKNPQQFNSAADQVTSFITATNDVYTTTTGTRAIGGGGTAFTLPPYPYLMDDTTNLQAAIQAGAGPR